MAEAENKKGDADLLAEKRKGIEMQLKAAHDRAKNQIDEFEAQTGRIEAQIKAKEAGTKLETERIEKFGKQLDNTEKIIDITSLLQVGKKLSTGMGQG